MLTLIHLLTLGHMLNKSACVSTLGDVNSGRVLTLGVVDYVCVESGGGGVLTVSQVLMLGMC